jgi:hypothetical protein
MLTLRRDAGDSGTLRRQIVRAIGIDLDATRDARGSHAPAAGGRA